MDQKLSIHTLKINTCACAYSHYIMLLSRPCNRSGVTIHTSIRNSTVPHNNNASYKAATLGMMYQHCCSISKTAVDLPLRLYWLCLWYLNPGGSSGKKGKARVSYIVHDHMLEYSAKEWISLTSRSKSNHLMQNRSKLKNCFSITHESRESGVSEGSVIGH